MSEKTYILNVYNTMTGEFELVQVTKEVFQTYRRTKWHIEDSTERFYRQLRRWCASPCVIFWICSRRRIMS